MTQDSPIAKHQFIATILHALHIKFDMFMYNLVHHHTYEIILYLWINKLYRKGISSDHAIQILYKARNILLLTHNENKCWELALRG
ncbi:hypothetical protein [Aquimarina aggregata]|uniref:hypothetical protein n=1 Tax=Aquimarina aggregata TaxID=1642818 RepID=UPI0024903A62|nr:hypothetical protein [Aquimarina aggregata]